MLSPSARLPRTKPVREYNLTAGSIVSPKRMVPPHPFPLAPILAGIIEKKKKRKHQQIERQTRVSTWIPRDLAGAKGKEVRQDVRSN